MYGLLECYGKPKASITRLRMEGKGSYNLSKNADEVLWKKQVYFKTTDSDKLLTIIDEMKHAEVVAKHQPRFIIAINATHLLAIDTKTEDTLHIPLAELNKKFDFFLPWAGLERLKLKVKIQQMSKPPRRWRSSLTSCVITTPPPPKKKFTARTSFYPEFCSATSLKTPAF